MFTICKSKAVRISLQGEPGTPPALVLPHPLILPLHLDHLQLDQVHHHHLNYPLHHQLQYSHCQVKIAHAIFTVQHLKENLNLKNQLNQDHNPNLPIPNHIAVQLYTQLSQELPHLLPHHCLVQPQHSSPLAAPDKLILRKKLTCASETQ